MATRSIAKSALVCLSSLCLFLPTLTHAETFLCTAGDVGCVIASIAKSNANGPAHDYLFLRAGTYMLTRVDNVFFNEPANGLPIVTGALTIVGAGQGVTLLARDPNAPLFRLLEVAPTGGLTVAYVTLQGGELNLAASHRGGCVFNRGSMMLYHSTIRECSATDAGAMFSLGQLTLLHATVIENYARDFCGGVGGAGGTVHIESSWIGSNVADTGGGVCGTGSARSGRLRIVRSVIQDNVTTGGDGGGMEVWGTVEIERSLISDNFSSLRGGGAALDFGQATVTNSTFWGNQAEIAGGGAYVTEGKLVLKGVAVLFNTAGIPGLVGGQGGGLAVGQSGQGEAVVENTWLLWNEADDSPECSGNVTASGWVVSGDAGVFDTGSPCD